MADPSDKPQRIYLQKEALKRLDISTTAGRDWIILYEKLVAPLPRESDKSNATRLVSAEVIKHIRAARSILANSGYGMTTEDALRTVLGMELAPLENKDRDNDQSPQAFAAAVAVAVRTELHPLLEKIERLEHKIDALEAHAAEPRALPSSVEMELEKTQSPRPNTFFNRLKNVFGRGEK